MGSDNSENVNVNQRHDYERSKDEAEEVEIHPVSEVDDENKGTNVLFVPSKIPAHWSETNLQEFLSNFNRSTKCLCMDKDAIHGPLCDSFLRDKGDRILSWKV